MTIQNYENEKRAKAANDVAKHKAREEKLQRKKQKHREKKKLQQQETKATNTTQEDIPMMVRALQNANIGDYKNIQSPSFNARTIPALVHAKTEQELAMRKHCSGGLKLQDGMSRQGQRHNNQMTLLQTSAVPKMPNLSELACRKSSKQLINQHEPKTPASTSKTIKPQQCIRNESELKKYEQPQSSLSTGDPQKNARYDSCLRQQKVQTHKFSEFAVKQLKNQEQAHTQPKKNLTVKLIKKDQVKVENSYDGGIDSGEQDLPFSGSK